MLLLLPFRLRQCFVKYFFCLVIIIFPLFRAHSAPIGEELRHAILFDYRSQIVLASKNADALIEPASMSKMMTLYVLFKKLEEGLVSLDSEFKVSRKAWRMGGSRMFLEAGSMVSLEDLIRGIIVHSGNDACVAAAEGVSGGVRGFVDEMNETASDLGLFSSNFVNTTGWPSPGHLSTVYDLSILAYRLIKDFPQYYHYFSEKEFTYNGIYQRNRNPLLYLSSLKADGLKTGHTMASGYSLAASASRQNRRLILVVSGVDTSDERAEESSRILEWGFRRFDNHLLFVDQSKVIDAKVWLGDKRKVPLLASTEVVVTMPKGKFNDMEVKAVYNGYLKAPLKKGDKAGELIVTLFDKKQVRVDLVIGEDIGKAEFYQKLRAYISYFIFGLN